MIQAQTRPCPSSSQQQDRHGGHECHYQPCPGVIGTSQRHSCDFIPSFFSSFLSSSLQCSPWNIPPATQLFAIDPRAPGGGACLASCHQTPFPEPTISSQPVPHPSWHCWRRAAQIQHTNQPQCKLEQGFQQVIGSARAHSQLLGNAGTAKLRLSS